MQKKIIIFVIVALVIIAGIGIGSGIWFNGKYTKLKNTIEAANAGELQRKLDTAIDSLDRTTAELIESRQSVAELTELDQRRISGVERIEGIAESVVDGIIRAQSGNERTERALRGIAEIIDALEAEFGGSAKRR